MQRYTPEELAEVLNLHGKWWREEEGGSRADLRDADLRDADLRDADLGDANLCGANLRGADLYGANLGGANLGGANLRGANLRGANLYGANLGGANLGDANLCGANLYGADLYGANLRGANLRDADLYGVDLRGANLRGADLGGGLVISTMRVLSGLYNYQCWAIVSDKGIPWVRMGCLLKTVADWDTIGIRKSNPGEFPDDGSRKSERRVRAFDFTRAEAMILAAEFKGSEAK